MYELTPWLWPLVTGFLVTAIVMPGVIWLAHRLGWVARPRADRWSKRPTALMGGIGIFIGTTAAALAFGRMETLLPIALPAVAMFVLGMVDDRMNLRPHVKFVGQLVATAIPIVYGIKFGGMPPLLALPITFLWIVGITNAVNLLDNMDGLAAGVSGISALALAFHFHAQGDAAMLPPILALAGACGGFLLYNFNPARIFMGDCGSMFLGFTLAGMAVAGTNRSAPNLALALLVPVSMLAIPIFDTTLVSVSRTLHGRSISQGGRDHSSHRLVALGLSERATVLVLYALTALFGCLALLASRYSLFVVAPVALLLFLCLFALGLYLGFLKVYEEDRPAPAQVRLLNSNYLHKKQVLQVLIDFLLVPVAFVGAHLLRFEGDLYPEAKNAVMAALPLVLAAKLTGLALCRAYRGVWRYAGMVDVIAAAAGSFAGSVLAAALIAAITGFQGLSRSALITDWALFTILVVGARTGFVALRQLFGMLPPKEGPRVVILGFGSEAMSLIARLRDPHSARRAHVLGILDDDPNKQRRALNGIPVLGPLADLPEIVDAQEVSCCLLGVPPQSDAGREILELCGQLKIAVYRDLDTPLLGSPA